MADPSPTYSWQLPSVGQESWAQTVSSIFQAVDGTIGSLAVVPRLPKGTVVFSFVAGTTTTVLSNGGGTWQQISCAPYGAFIGSLEMLGNRNAFFDVRAAIAVNCMRNSPTPTPDQDMHVRLVINPGSLAIPGATSGMLWRRASYSNSEGRHCQFTGWLVASLATGKFSVAIQQFSTGSARWMLTGTGGCFHVVAWEAGR